MYDTHAMIDTPAGLKLTNKLIVTGPLKWLWIKLVAQNVADTVPEEMENLVKFARGINVWFSFCFWYTSHAQLPNLWLWQRWYALRLITMTQRKFQLLTGLSWRRWLYQNLLKKLVQIGFINRIEHEVDTRAKSISLIPKGKDMVRTLVPIIEGIDSTFFIKAFDQEQKSLMQILAKLTAGSTDE